MSERLRILHLRNSDVLGGPERLLLDQAALAAPDIEPVIASFGPPDVPHAFLDAARAQGIAVRLLPQRNSYDPRLRRRVRRLVDEVDAHVLVSHDYKANLLARFSGRGRPRVAVVHGYTAEGPKVRFFEAVDRRVLRGMERVVVVSPGLGERLAAGGVSPRRLRTVPNGIRTEAVRAAAQAGRAERRAAWGAGAGDLVCLSLGRLSPEKGQDVLLDAFEALAARGAPGGPRLVLAGDGASRRDLERRAGRPLLAGRVRFLGWRDDPWACLGAADVFALPSRREGVPIALLEAMACGLAVVATRVGSVPEILDQGRCGRLVDPDDAQGLCLALEDLTTDADLRARLGRDACARARTHYGAEAQARRLEAIYREVALPRGRPRGPA